MAKEFPLSAKNRKWIISEPDEALFSDLMRTGLSALEARIVAQRGIRPAQIPNLLEPRIKTQLPDPLVLKNMDIAVTAIINAIKAKKRITIFADYDVDGATSAAIISAWFDAIGYSTNIFIPDRIKDGYGPSPQLMRSIKETGTELLLTLDCGAAAHDALKEAQAIGLDVVVFDHHLMLGDAPPAIAIVNPNQDGDNSGLGNLTAAGVCFMAVIALNRAWKEGGGQSNFAALELLDLVALGTICDVAPLTDLNRVFVSQGQKILGQKRRIGLKVLSDVAGLKKSGNVYAAAWVLGPRLNAGGRIGDSTLAVSLLNATDENKAKRIAQELDLLNSERRAIEQAIIDEAVQMVEKSNSLQNAQIIVVGKEGWHPGIIGIVAGRLKERFNKPVIILGTANEGDIILKGSGRSVSGVNLGGIIKAAVDEGILISGGGHKMAAGLAIEDHKIQILQEFLENRISDFSNIDEMDKNHRIDALIATDSINMDTINALERLAPFGQGWEEPIFCVPNAKITSSQLMNGGHLRVFFTDGEGKVQKSVCFGAHGTLLGDIIEQQRNCSLIIKVKKDEWRGQNSVDTEIIDAISEFVAD